VDTPTKRRVPEPNVVVPAQCPACGGPLRFITAYLDGPRPEVVASLLLQCISCGDLCDWFICDERRLPNVRNN
jgi:hypothetical protein